MTDIATVPQRPPAAPRRPGPGPVPEALPRAARLPGKFLLLPAIQLVAITGFLLGGSWTFLGAAVFVFLALACDYIPDRSQSADLGDLGVAGRRLLHVIVALHGALLVTGLARAAAWDGLLPLIGTIISLRQVASTASFIAHELMHSSRAAERETGLLMFSLAGHPVIGIDHVHNHHVQVALPDDPLRPRRGETLNAYMRRSIPAEIRGAWRFETRRLANRGLPPLHPQNRVLRGTAYLLAWFALVAALLGPLGLLAAVLTAISTLRGLEKFNYTTHYGLIRAPGEKVGLRHSWNSRLVISSGFTLNANGHSHHHAAPAKPFWQVHAAGDLPVQPFGPGMTLGLLAFPRLWVRVMAPLLADWDRRFATPEERALLRAEGHAVAEPGDAAAPRLDPQAEALAILRPWALGAAALVGTGLALALVLAGAAVPPPVAAAGLALALTLPVTLTLAAHRARRRGA